MPQFDDLIGVPYLDGGRDPKKGLDCWGLVIEVFRRYGVPLPDYVVPALDSERINSIIEEERPLWKRHRWPRVPSPSVVVIRFNTVDFCNHTGVYLGDGRFLHTRQKIGVNVDRVESPAWERKIEGFYTPAGW